MTHLVEMQQHKVLPTINCVNNKMPETGGWKKNAVKI